MILLCEKITRLSEIFNRRLNVILPGVGRTINASRRVLKKDDFYNRNPRFKHGQKGRVLPLLLVTGESGDISRRPICRSGTLSNFCRYNTAKFYVAAPLKEVRSKRRFYITMTRLPIGVSGFGAGGSAGLPKGIWAINFHLTGKPYSSRTASSIAGL